MPTKPRTHKPARAAGNRRHDSYQITVRRTPHLATARAVRSSGRWKGLRRSMLARNPLCADPHQHHARAGELPPAATQVHHVKPIETHPQLAYDPDNLMSVCHHCHGIFSGRERRRS